MLQLKQWSKAKQRWIDNNSARCYCCCNNSGCIFGHAHNHPRNTMTEWQVRISRCFLCHMQTHNNMHIYKNIFFCTHTNYVAFILPMNQNAVNSHKHRRTQRHRWPSPYGRHQIRLYVQRNNNNSKIRSRSSKTYCAASTNSLGWQTEGKEGNGIGLPCLFVCVSCSVAIKFRLNQKGWAWYTHIPYRVFSCALSHSA